MSVDLGSGGQRSILARKIKLAELLEVETFRELCASFVDLYQIGLKVFDEDGGKLVDIRVGSGDWCGYIFSHAQGRGMCTGLVTQIKQHGYPELERGEAVMVDCFSGLRYVILPIHHGGDLLGRIVYGPYVPQGLARPGAAVYEYAGGFDPDRLWAFAGSMRRLPDETVQKIMANFRRVLETVVGVAYRALMTQHLHLESISASYNELTDTNRSLREALERQKEIDRMKSSFLAMLSHELKTPLTSIIGYSEMLLEGMASSLAEQRDFITTIQEKGQALLEMITAMLELSKVEAGAFTLHLRECDPLELVRAAQRTVVPMAQKKKLTLDVEVSGPLPRLLADREKLVQVIVNLCVNAVKFTPESGRIVIRAGLWRGERRYSGEEGRFGRDVEDFVRFEVQDNGIGVPPDKLEAIFRPFYQVENTYTREQGGSGLGLAIVKSFVEAHKGEVWAENRKPSGTCFVVIVPLPEAPK